MGDEWDYFGEVAAAPLAQGIVEDTSGIDTGGHDWYSFVKLAADTTLAYQTAVKKAVPGADATVSNKGGVLAVDGAAVQSQTVAGIDKTTLMVMAGAVVLVVLLALRR